MIKNKIFIHPNDPDIIDLITPNVGICIIDFQTYDEKQYTGGLKALLKAKHTYKI